MKTTTQEQISRLISYSNDKTSAYVDSDDLEELAEILSEEGDDLEDVKSSILNDIESYLEDYEYIECKNQGAFDRNIFHKIQ